MKRMLDILVITLALMALTATTAKAQDWDGLRFTGGLSDGERIYLDLDAHVSGTLSFAFIVEPDGIAVDRAFVGPRFRLGDDSFSLFAHAMIGNSGSRYDHFIQGFENSGFKDQLFGGGIDFVITNDVFVKSIFVRFSMDHEYLGSWPLDFQPMTGWTRTVGLGFRFN